MHVRILCVFVCGRHLLAFQKIMLVVHDTLVQEHGSKVLLEKISNFVPRRPFFVQPGRGKASLL
jgi:hypothetical protein